MKTPKFALEREKVILSAISPYTQTHNGETIPGACLRFEFLSNNAVLSLFHPSLRALLYEKVKGNLVDTTLMLPRFGALIQKIALNADVFGADASIALPVSTQDIRLSCVDVYKFVAELHNDQHLTLKFAIKAQLTGEQIKRLYEALSTEVFITIIPPAARQSSLDV